MEVAVVKTGTTKRANHLHLAPVKSSLPAYKRADIYRPDAIRSKWRQLVETAMLTDGRATR